MTYTASLSQSLNWQHKATWQIPDTPFMTFDFWQALTDTGAIGEAAGWLAIYIVINETGDDAHDKPVAVMPVFIKNHHQGEYVFDHAWAQAYSQYGVDYYPRLVTCVPFTPVTGQRIWLADNISLTREMVQVAFQAVTDIAKQVGASSWHGLFVTEATVELAIGKPTASHASAPNLPQLLKREGNQFLWHNHDTGLSMGQEVNEHQKNYTSFDQFLATLTAKKRKNIRSERKKIAKQSLTCIIKTGAEISPSDWDVFYQCYAMTYAIRGREPYLNQAFFLQLAQRMPQHLMLAQALDLEGQVVASSLFFYDDPSKSDATLYGRYWGSLGEYDSLHFELCYYQGIEFAINKGLQYFDPGTQGEHKLVRGFVPTKTHSLHFIFDPRFEPAISEYCAQDRAYMLEYRKQAHAALPFNTENMPEFKG